MAVVLKRRRFTIEEYHRMGEVSILSEDEHLDRRKASFRSTSPGPPSHGRISGVARV